MRIAIDARPALDPRKTGVGYYAQNLIRRLPFAAPDAACTAWYLHAKGAVRPRRFFEDVTAPNFAEKGTPFPARLFEPLSSRLSMPRLEWFVDFDALLATNFLPPATRSRGVVLVVHDLAFRLFPETAPHADARWQRRLKRWLREAARVIVPSAAAKRDLVELEGVPPERVEAIHHGVDPAAFRPPAPGVVDSVRRRFGLEGSYLLFVGGIEPRKNLPALVRAFAKLPPAATLVIAGGPVRWFPQAERRLRATVEALPPGLRRRVVLTGYVSDPDKVALLSGATAVVYVSLSEGFGFPILEAMASGTPVLCSTASSLPEVAGEAAVLVDPQDVDAMAAAMAGLLEDPALRERLREAGRARAGTFTWDETARRTAAVLRAAAAGG